ncbi:MAG: hypothetical protein K9G67_06290 [Bacteroidales bacterium]|nr:hypothetical protein [Bacteroidales bacterium]MCF8343535.1 hypothetical protein [Bacteroidales bacterium]MCF8349826.1 hypothetical protein [Bacteroidales bacterium]MCF8375946.1 hypothetical protein [Bacteroidales bacterium]
MKNKEVAKKLFEVITELKNTKSLREINNIEKLKGYDKIYRIRIKDYRLGIFFDRNRIELARFLHRKDIYKYFP